MRGMPFERLVQDIRVRRARVESHAARLSRGHPVARSGHWREYGDVLGRRCADPAATAGRRSRSSRCCAGRTADSLDQSRSGNRFAIGRSCFPARLPRRTRGSTCRRAARVNSSMASGRAATPSTCSACTRSSGGCSPPRTIVRAAGGRTVAVISHAFWQRRFGGSPDAIGKTLTIERVPFTIVGVAPPAFFGVEVGKTFDVAVPIGTATLIRSPGALRQRSSWWLRIMIRLQPGQSPEAATALLRGLQPNIRAATLPDDWHPWTLPQCLRDPFRLELASSGDPALRTKYNVRSSRSRWWLR